MSHNPELKMLNERPYLIRAYHEWIIDSDMTPQIVVDATHPDVRVPLQCVVDGKIVLTISYRATECLEMSGALGMSFRARFNGTPFDVYVPFDAVTAIVARETGRGAAFVSRKEEAKVDETPVPETPVEKRVSHLKVVK